MKEGEDDEEKMASPMQSGPGAAPEMGNNKHYDEPPI